MNRRCSFDHRLLAQRHPIEVARFRNYLARFAGQGLVVHPNIEHEADGSCCAMEPWAMTLMAVMQELPSGQRTARPGSASNPHRRSS